MLSLECVPRLHLRKNTDLATAARTAKSLQARTLEKRPDGYFAVDLPRDLDLPHDLPWAPTETEEVAYVQYDDTTSNEEVGEEERRTRAYIHVHTYTCIHTHARLTRRSAR